MKTHKFHQLYHNKAGEIVPGASTISGLHVDYGSKDTLTDWAVDLTKKGFDYKEVRKYEGRCGTLFHFLAEQYLKTGEIDNYSDPYVKEFTEPEQERAKMAYRSFCKWKDTFTGDLNRAISEESMVSEIFQYGGTIDLYGECSDGTIWVLDFKTSKGIYDQHWIQLAGYSKLLEEVKGKKVSKMIIVSCSKEEEGKYSAEYMDSDGINEVFILFLNLRVNYSKNRNIKKLKKRLDNTVVI
jgi:hypothetical protein